MRGTDGVTLPLATVCLRDEPGCGNCCFHTIQRELAGGGPAARPNLLLTGMDQGRDGQTVREWMLNYVCTTAGTISGAPAQYWLDRPLARYER